jgi:putative tricarboxylic transport membrane protein
MESLQHLLTGLSIAATPINLLYCFLGCLAGTLVGVLPGIGPQGAIALILPATFHLPPVSAIIMFAGILYGAMYGGSTTSILVNIPGESASIITCVDGHKMALQGRAGPALGIAAFGSFIAGTLCLFGLVFMAPILAEYCLSFGPPEFFALMIFALSTLIYLAQGSMAKGLMMALLGLMLANIGLDLVTGTPRFVYDLLSLRDGLGLVPMVIGLFGVSEILLTLEKGVKGDIYQSEVKGLLPTLQDWKDSIFPITRGTVIGFFLGIIPGLSVVIPTFISYTLEKKISKHPEVNVVSSIVFAGPKGLPPAVIKAWEDAVTKIGNDNAFISKVRKLGADVTFYVGAENEKYLRNELKNFSRFTAEELGWKK